MKIQVSLFQSLIYGHEYNLVVNATLHMCLVLLDKLFYNVKRAEHVWVTSPRDAHSQFAKGLDERAWGGGDGFHSLNVS